MLKITLFAALLLLCNCQTGTVTNTACPHTATTDTRPILTQCDATVAGSQCIRCRVDAQGTVCFSADGLTWLLDNRGVCPRPEPTTTTDTRAPTTAPAPPPPTQAGETRPPPTAAPPTQAAAPTSPINVPPPPPPCVCPNGSFCRFDGTNIVGCTETCVCPSQLGDPSTCRLTADGPRCEPKPIVCPAIACLAQPPPNCRTVVRPDGCPSCEFVCECNCAADQICRQTLTGATECAPRPACIEGATRPSLSCPHALVDTCTGGQWTVSRQACPVATCPPLDPLILCPTRPGCYYVDNIQAPAGACPRPCQGLYCPPVACEHPCEQNAECVLPTNYATTATTATATTALTANVALIDIKPFCRCREGSTFVNRAGETCTCANGVNTCVAPPTPVVCDNTQVVRLGCNTCPCGADGKRFCLSAPCVACSGPEPDVPAGVCYRFACNNGQWVRVETAGCVEPPPRPRPDPSTNPCWRCEAVNADTQATGSTTATVGLAFRPVECVFTASTCPRLVQCDSVAWRNINDLNLASLRTRLAADTNVHSHNISVRPDGSVRGIICQRLPPATRPTDPPRPLPPVIATDNSPQSAERLGATFGTSGAAQLFFSFALLAVVFLML